ncbi:MGDG synthase family glycosyltransferase [Georgenia ruanii]|nr:glycosyltransferase [Georgenia ruanii]MPV90329.1 glycosyltransferase [Georgenia ruanii]
MLMTPSTRPHPAGRDRPPADGAPAVLILSGSVGAGHDGAAQELARRLRGRGVDVDVRDYLEALPGWYRILLREGYTASVNRVPAVFQWLFDNIEHNRWVRGAAILSCHLGDRRVRHWAGARQYGAVVSTYPLASQTLGTLRARGRLVAPAVTYLTDPAAHRTWVHRHVDLHLTVTPATAEQGEATYGIPMRAAGPLVPPRFAGDLDPVRRARLRAALGIGIEQRVALLVSGSLGLGDLEGTSRAVQEAGLVPLVLCGRNAALRRRLSALPGVLACGWRDDVHELMHLADVLVHNAGGLSYTEALVAGLPAVSYRCIAGHGRANAAVLERSGSAPWARSAEQFARALNEQASRCRAGARHGDPADQVLGLLTLSAAGDHLLPAARTAGVIGPGRSPAHGRAAGRLFSPGRREDPAAG